MNNLLADLMDDLQTENHDAAWCNSIKFFEKFGFHITNYGVIDKASDDIVGFHSNMADDWMAHYMAMGYGKDDPWAQHVFSKEQTILYSRRGASELVVEKSSAAEKMLNEVSDHGLNTSICIPIHNKFGCLITGFNLGSELHDAEFQAMLDENMDEILLGTALINNQLLDTDPMTCAEKSWFMNPSYKPLLTERELEVLKWLSEGNRNDRIADKMNIAAVTVNFHLKEIRRKLGAKTREQSVALAFKKGLLR